MQLLKIIFFFEWHQFVRRPVLAISLICFFIAGCYAIFYGNNVIRIQQTVTDSIQVSYKKNYDLQYNLISADTTTQQGKSDHYMAGIPEVVNYRIAPVAIFCPSSLSGLSIGQRDVQSYYQVVTKDPQYIDQNAEINNPVKLAAGNFDLSFLIVYLFPLLVIAFCYNVFSQEKEQGTITLLMVQGITVHQLIIYKLLFRGLLLGLTLILLNITGAIVLSFTVDTNVRDILLWQYLSGVYLLLWLSIVFAICLFRQASIVNDLYLLAVWLLFLIVLPALGNTYVSLKHPVPLQSGLASFQREVREHIWEMDRKALLDTFYKNNPSYINLSLATDTGEYNSKRFVAFYDLVDRRINAKAREMEFKATLSNNAESELAMYNPSVKMLQLYSELSGNAMVNFETFNKEVQNFQLRWKDFINGFLMYDKNLTVKDYHRLPVFKANQGVISSKYVIAESISLWVAILGFMLLGLVFRQSSSKHK